MKIRALTLALVIVGVLAVPALAKGKPVPPTTTAASPYSITSCRDITSPGVYTITANIAASTDCLSVHDTTNVDLNCAGHTITAASSVSGLTAVSVRNVTGFSLANCNIVMSQPPPQLGYALRITDSSHGNVHDNTFSGRAILQSDTSSWLAITANRFTNALIQQNANQHNQITRNQLGFTGYNGAGLIVSDYGSDNTINANTLDGFGGIDLNGNVYGFDDAIVIQSESNDRVTGNTMQNLYDCGIETVGFIQATTITGNTITNAHYCGIGGWYLNSWLGNTVSDNRVSYSTYLFVFYRMLALNGSEQFVYFKDNLFSGNTFANAPRTSRGATVSMDPAANAYVPAAAFVLGNNTFTANDFGASPYAPVLAPGSMIVDGGGNRCGASTAVLQCAPSLQP